MKINIITVGKPSNAHYQNLSDDYIKRLSHYVDAHLVHVRAEKIFRQSEETIRTQEANRLLQKVDDKDWCIVLDRKGKKLSSEQLAEKMSVWLLSSRKKLDFLIGGPLGISESVYERADEIISLSDLTFAHELSLVIILEQLYRAFTILRGEKYHK